MALKEIVEQTVAGLGYELVEIQRSTGGLLRITVDIPWAGVAAVEGSHPIAEQFVTVEDCEKITRQLLYALEVDGIDFKRLEVSSPGIDRLLRNQRDFERFVGQVIDLTLKVPLGASTEQVSANRKKFRGTLERGQLQEGGSTGAPNWQVVWSEVPVVKPGQRVSKSRPLVPLQVLGFSLDELKEARLAPIVSFKGRTAKPKLD